MSWKVEYLPEAEKDLKGLDGSQRNLVLKAIKKVQQNPLPVDEQGYGKPLGNHNSTNLAGLLKIKLRSAGLRIVYALHEEIVDDHIRQFFCMTHNPYFFREISYNRLPDYECVSFFEIKKDTQNQTSITESYRP